MGTILAAIENSAIKEIEAEGMLWRVRKICSADLARVGHAALAMAQGMEAGAPSSKKPKKKTEQQAAADIAAMPVENIQAMAKLKDSVIAAGLMAVGDAKAKTFEDVTVVLEADKANADAGRIWVGAIPNEIADLIFAEVMNLSTDGGAALERLRAFRGGSGDTAGGGQAGKKVRRSTK